MTEPMNRVIEILTGDSGDSPDGINMSFFPSKEATGHLDATPYHLLGFGEDVVVAMATGRLLLLTAVRVSAFYSSLENAGLTVRHNGKFDLWGDNAVASRVVATSAGNATLDFHFVYTAAECLREFLTLESIALRISEALAAVSDSGIADEYLAAAPAREAAATAKPGVLGGRIDQLLRWRYPYVHRSARYECRCANSSRSKHNPCLAYRGTAQLVRSAAAMIACRTPSTSSAVSVRSGARITTFTASDFRPSPTCGPA